MKKFHSLFENVALATALCWGAAQSAFALGFKNPDQDARATGQGEAFVAQADAPSAIYYNPAGLTQLQGTEISAGGLVAYRNIRYSGAAGTAELDAPAFLMHLYAATDFGLEKWRFGLGVNVPFGNDVNWGTTGPFATIVTESKLIVLNMQPTVAYQINDNLSIGVGLNVYHGNTELQRIVTPVFGGGAFRFDGDGQAVGATVGLLWKINEQHSIGAVYRSPFDITFDGRAFVAGSPLPGTGSSSASAEIEFPQSVAVGYAFRPIERLKLEVDVEWTDWDTLDSVVLSWPGSPFDGLTIPFNWESSFFYEFGVQYELSECWTLRAGYIFSENSVPNSTYSPFLPDSDRHVFSVGVGYKAKRWGVDFVYQYSLSENRIVTGSGDLDGDFVPGDTDGTWKSSAHAIVLTSTLKF